MFLTVNNIRVKRTEEHLYGMNIMYGTRYKHQHLNVDVYIAA